MEFAPILQLCASDPRIIALYSLGCAVNGNMRPDSDVDLPMLVMPGANQA